MEFRPDVIVTAPDSRGVCLVAEAKQDQTNPIEAERQLKLYMLRMSCPVGLIITPTHLRIYKDRFLERSEKSIELVGEFSVKGLFPHNPVRDPRLLESALVEWLDRLSRSGYSHTADDSLNAAVSQYVVPAVVGGAVSIAHPGHR